MPAAVQGSLGDAFETNSVQIYTWMVAVGGILAFAMAWGIGANDVANAFATSVGAGSLTLKWACVIAAVFEFSGALLMGGSVTDTVRKKIIDVDIFDPHSPEGAANGPEMLMTGFFVALISATTWLIIATYLSLPVSTTHSIIGSLVGVGIAYRGGAAVNWWSGTGLKKLRGVVGVILSWIISPVLSAIFAVVFFLIVRTLVLRRSDPYKNGLMFVPLFYGFAVALAVFFIIYKGDKRFKIADDLGAGVAVGIALGAGAVVAIFSAFVIVPLAKKYISRWEEREEEKLKNPDIEKEADAKREKIDSALKKVGVNVSIKEELDDDVVRMHGNVEVFDPKTERLFTWVQIFTAAFDAFAHGANDVANAIAPFASIFQLHRNHGEITKEGSDSFGSSGTYSGGKLNGGEFKEGDDIPNHESFCGVENDEDYFRCTEAPGFPFRTSQAPDAKSALFSVYNEDGVAQDGGDKECFTECTANSYNGYVSSKQDVPLWILALGGAGIVLGLAMWGYRIILAIGVKLTKLTPSRGFSIEIGAAITVLLASRVGIPVSTTHCQVGATMGVGLVEFKASTVNWKQFLYICIGWVFTVIFTGFMSAIIYLVITRSPANFPVPQGTPEYCPGNRLFLFDEEQNLFRGITCSGLDTE